MSRSTAEWQELDRRHHVHPFLDPRDLGRGRTRIITSGDGCWLTDSEDQRILETIAVQTAYAVENAQQAQALLDQNRELEAATHRAERRRAERELARLKESFDRDLQRERREQELEQKEHVLQVSLSLR